MCMTWVYSKVKLKFLNLLTLQQLDKHLKSEFFLAVAGFVHPTNGAVKLACLCYTLF